MIQSIVHIALVVKDYDEAIEFYTNKLHFTLIEDTYQQDQDKRWVVVSPPSSSGTYLQELPNPNNYRLLEIRQEDEFSYFLEQMIFGETITK